MKEIKLNIDIDYSYPYIFINDKSYSDINEYYHNLFGKYELTDQQKKEIIQNDLKDTIRQASALYLLSPAAEPPEPQQELMIFNPDDSLEVKVKNNLNIGDLFKNFKSMCNTVDLEVKGGNQKKLAERNLQQYMQYKTGVKKKTDIMITDIYDVPHYFEKTKGKAGFYVDRLLPVLIDFLSKSETAKIYTSYDDLGVILGLINDRYKKISATDLKESYPEVTHSKLCDLYYRSQANKEAIIRNILDRLRDMCLIDLFSNCYIIIDNDNNAHYSTDDENILILRTQKEVLNEFNVSKLSSVLRSSAMTSKFFKRVIEKINEENGLNWKRYKKQLVIYANNKELIKYLESIELSDEQLNLNRLEANKRFAQLIYNKLEKSYLNSLKYSDKQIFEKLNELSNNSDPDEITIKELCDLGYYDNKELARMFDVFRYHSNYLTGIESAINAVIRL